MMRLHAFALLITAHNLREAAGASTNRDCCLILMNPPGYSADRIPHLLNEYENDYVPEKCRDQTYCTIRPPNYPEEHFNELFNGVKSFSTPSLVTTPTVENRNIGEPDEQDDCETKLLFDPIYQVRQKRDTKWMTVVQAPKVNYTQKVRLEICRRPYASCFNIFSLYLTNDDMKIFCEQKQSLWDVLVANGTKIVHIAVDLPTCCSCVYKTKDVKKK